MSRFLSASEERGRAAPRAAEPLHAAPPRRRAPPRRAPPRRAPRRRAPPCRPPRRRAPPCRPPAPPSPAMPPPADQGEELVLLGGDLVGEQELADVGGAQEIDRVYLRGVGQAERLRHLVGRLQPRPSVLRLSSLSTCDCVAVVPGRGGCRRGRGTSSRSGGTCGTGSRNARLLVGHPAPLSRTQSAAQCFCARARPALVRGAEDDVAALDAADAALAGRALRAVDLEPVGGQRLCRGVTRERRVLRFALRPDDRAVGGALVGRRGRLGRIRHFQGGFKGFFGLRRDLRRLGFGVDVDVIRLRGRSGRHGVRQPRKRPIRCTHAVAR